MSNLIDIYGPTKRVKSLVLKVLIDYFEQSKLTTLVNVQMLVDKKPYGNLYSMWRSLTKPSICFESLLGKDRCEFYDTKLEETPHALLFCLDIRDYWKKHVSIVQFLDRYMIIMEIVLGLKKKEVLINWLLFSYKPRTSCFEGLNDLEPTMEIEHALSMQQILLSNCQTQW